MTKQKRLPQISQISTDAFGLKVLCKSAESVGVIIPLCLVGALREHLKGGVLSGGAFRGCTCLKCTNQAVRN